MSEQETEQVTEQGLAKVLRVAKQPTSILGGIIFFPK